MQQTCNFCKKNSGFILLDLVDKKESSPEFMNAYMKLVVGQMKSLAETGMGTTDENGTPITLTIVPLCCQVDSVGPSLLQNRLQYNGYCGCSWCYENGVTPEKLRELNKRLLNITPSHETHRLPRAFMEKAKWKATEWRSWLLFYSLICLQGLVPTEVLNHYALLVESIFILLQDSISEAELRACEEKLILFVAQCQEMFGNSVMTFNVHSLLHVVQSVRMTGPLWATSRFPFESAISYLKRAITGPKGMYYQIAKRTLQRFTFRYMCKKVASFETSVSFCD